MIRKHVLAGFAFSLCVLWLLGGKSPAEVPCKSGLQPDQRPGPYAFVVSTGPNRGKAHCFICETADRPGIVVFARSLSDPLGKLAARLDKALEDHKTADLRAWVTFLHDDQSALDPKVVEWAKKYAIRSLPLGVFEDQDGPPSYRLTREADVTVLLFVKQKVVANFAFRAGELNAERIAGVLKTVPKIAGALPQKGTNDAKKTAP